MIIRLFLIFFLLCFQVFANELPNTLEKIRPSIVALAAYNPLSSPNSMILGTGFAIGDGTLIATNAHVIKHKKLNNNKNELLVYIGHGHRVKGRKAKIVAMDETHDLAIVRISGTALIPLTLSNQKIREGEHFAFTGFPIANTIGLYPVTHQGIISSISPIAMPADSVKNLSAKHLKLLRNPYNIYLIDAISYSGNSGSPVYDLKTGKVVAVISKRFVNSTNASLLSAPSSITYAISIRHLQSLLEQKVES